MAVLEKDIKTLANIPAEEKAKEWFKLWKSIISNLQESSAGANSLLLQVLSLDKGARNWNTIKHLTEFGLGNSKNFHSIFSRIASKIKSDSTDYDDIINAMLAEVRVIPFLKLLGFSAIECQRQDSLDFMCQFDGAPFQIEVTYVSGQSKMQEIAISADKLGVKTYEMKSQKLISRFKSKYAEKKEHIEKYKLKARAIIVIVTDLLETDSICLDHNEFQGKHPIQAFVDSCEISTIVFGAHTNMYFSSKLADFSLKFDRDKYIELAYGIDVKEEAAVHKEIEKQLNERFWKGYNALDSFKQTFE